MEEGYGVVLYHRSMLGEAFGIHWGLGIMVIYESIMVGYMGHCTVICGGRMIWGSGIP